MSDAKKSAGTVIARNKIRSLAELRDIATQVRAEGKTVVLAHGTFDLLHMGHVRHIEEAHRLGDVLIITVTADKHVNKGPGRPVFTDMLRAEMLAALGYVDWVGINEAASAENVIDAVRPDVYVKGSDYQQAEDDVTGKIVDERRQVEAHGGRIHFTDDITFSSSSLLNRHFSAQRPELRAYLDDVRQRDVGPKMLEALESIAGYRVLIVGDAIIDEYRYVSPLGKSSKENLVATLLRGSDCFAGGVVAAANHVAGFCAEVEVITCLGSVDSYEDLIRESIKPNVRLTAITRPGMPTTCKSRFVEQDYLKKLFEVYVMEDTPLHGEVEERLLAELEAKLDKFDVVIVTDFGHGMITPRVTDLLQAKAKFLAVNTQSNSANYGFNLITKYRRADYLCIDAPEARLAVANKYADLTEIAGDLLPRRIACDRMILTHGRHGCVTYDRLHGMHQIPAFATQAIDTMGAGDAVFAITSPLVAAGVNMEVAGFIGNAAGAIKINILGHRSSVEKVPLIKYLTTLLK